VSRKWRNWQQNEVDNLDVPTQRIAILQLLCYYYYYYYYYYITIHTTLRPLYISISRQAQLKTAGFCWSKQLLHLDYAEDVRVLFSGVSCTFSTSSAILLKQEDIAKALKPR